MKEQASAAQLITLSDPTSAVAEAYRTLRTNLEFAALGHELRTLVVTNPGVGEGKSTTLANLAVTIAQAGQRVLLVDADMRRPAQHRIFGMSNEQGLSTLLLNRQAMNATEPLGVETGVANLRLVPSGPTPPNPAELIASEPMRELIARMGEQADIVLFDAPPVVPVTDAALLGARTNGVLLVLQAGKTKREQAARARTLLEQVGVRIVGTALTNARVDAVLGGY